VSEYGALASPIHAAASSRGMPVRTHTVDALGGTISEPAWKTKPSCYLVAADDKMIPPPAQRLVSQRAGSTVVEVAGSHAICVSNPSAVASLIEKAALHVSAGGTQARTAVR
jgi:hypothetical protein